MSQKTKAAKKTLQERNILPKRIWYDLWGMNYTSRKKFLAKCVFI